MRTAVALELVYLLSDATDWQTTLEFIDTLPSEIPEHPVVYELRALSQSGSAITGARSPPWSR